MNTITTLILGRIEYYVEEHVEKNPWHGKYHIVLFGQNHMYMNCDIITESRHVFKIMQK
jgi:hypothetical protein